MNTIDMFGLYLDLVRFLNEDHDDADVIEVPCEVVDVDREVVDAATHELPEGEGADDRLQA